MTDDTKKKETAEEKLSKNAIRVFRSGAPLQQAVNCGLILQVDSIRGAIDGAWPGDSKLTVDERADKTRKLIGQAKIAIENSDRPAALLECTGPSILDTLTSCASLDLSLTKALGEAFLVPFAKTCTLMIGYKGFIKLIINTGFVTHIECVLIYEGEKFKLTRDENGPHWKHDQSLVLQGQVDKIVGAYAVGYTRTGASIIEVMSRDELDKVRKTSKMADAGAYRAWLDQMFRKAPIRRLSKWLPKTGEDLATQILAEALKVDNQMFDVERQQKYASVESEWKQQRQSEKDADFKRRMALADEPLSPESATAVADGLSDASAANLVPGPDLSVQTVGEVDDAIIGWLSEHYPDMPDVADLVEDIRPKLALRATGKADADWTDPEPWTAEACGLCAADLAANGLDAKWLPKGDG